MQTEQQQLQGQATQAAPQTGIPQDSGTTNLQQTVDQAGYESSRSTQGISPPKASSGSATVSAQTPPAEISSQPVFYDISAAYLIAAFVLAVVFIGLLAKLAIAKSPVGVADLPHEEAMDIALDRLEATEATNSSAATLQRKRPKKTTRRQRRRKSAANSSHTQIK